MDNLFPYAIRVSKRSKYLRLQVTSQKGLEIVIPKGYDQTRIPQILQSKQAWLQRVLGIANAKKEFHQAQPILPENIFLPAINQSWQVRYVDLTCKKLTSKKPKYFENPDSQLTITTTNPELCHQLLRQWLLSVGKRYLPPELAKISLMIGLPFSEVAIKRQKTIWGSCTAKKVINLNYKLLFLPQPLVRYVFVHELCHTAQMNHSEKFWQLVARFEPNYQEFDRQLRDVWKIVPPWM